MCAVISNMSKFLFSVLLITFLLIQAECNEWRVNTSETLQNVFVVFRHGDRTPDNYCKCTFNITQDYWPVGIGQLTNQGKNEEFNIGLALREKYGGWLGDTFYPEILKARSTNYDRTKASLLLVLAGLFPPKNNQIWNYELPWQPIPFDFTETNDMLLGYPTKCKNYRKEYLNVIHSPKVQRIIASKKALIEYVDNNIAIDGRKELTVSPIEDLFLTYFCFKAMEGTGTPLPSWSRIIYPDVLAQMAVLEYHLKALEDDLIQYTGGYLLRRILNDTENVVLGVHDPEPRKMYLYSGHEYNVALILLALDAFEPEVPNYAAYVVIELHLINGVYGYKVFYQNYVEADPILLTIPGCKEFCPLDNFKEIMKNRLAPNDLTC